MEGCRIDSITAATACVRTVYILPLNLRFASPAGRVCGVATHSVGGDSGYSLLPVVNQGALARAEGVVLQGGKGDIHISHSLNLRLLLIIDKPQTITRWIDKFYRPSGANAKGFA